MKHVLLKQFQSFVKIVAVTRGKEAAENFICAVHANWVMREAVPLMPVVVARDIMKATQRWGTHCIPVRVS
jgi:hypothetical protein